MTRCALPTPRPYRPGGRWERILRATSRFPLRQGEIELEIRDGRHSRRVERVKLWRALTMLQQQGLIAPTGDGAFIATAAGIDALQQQEPAQ